MTITTNTIAQIVKMASEILHIFMPNKRIFGSVKFNLILTKKLITGREHSLAPSVN
jgi:hypothetical protein